MSFVALGGSLLPIGAAILLGFVIKRWLMPNEAHWAGLNKITFYILIPCLIIATMTQADIAAIPMRAIGLAVAIAIAVVMSILWAVYVFTPKDAAAKASFSSVFQTATRWNAAVALAIAGEIYGAAAVATIAIAMLVLMPMVNIVNVTLLTHLLTERRVSPLESMRRVLANPIIIGCIIGALLSLAEIAIWQPLSSLLNTLATASNGLILLCVGAGLKLSRLSSDGWRMAIACTLKLALMPLLTLLAAGCFDVRGVPLAGIVLVAAVPTAMNGYVLAREMGGDAPLYANIASLQILLSFITLPGWIWLAEVF